MSKILAVISEYNPFHNGHLYHLNKSKQIVNPDYSICIMSGNFVQRGEPAIIDKWSRTEIALKNGFDMVIELPTIYSISSAENFAQGAIKILSNFNDVTLSFGSESGDLSSFNEIVDVLLKEPPKYVTILNHELSKGLSYPKARENALLFYLLDIKKYSGLVSTPNNILAIEYLKAIKKIKSKVLPITIKRIGTDYNSLKYKGRLASATAIRDMIEKEQSVKPLVPKSSFNILNYNMEHGKSVSGLKTFEKEIIYSLRKMTLSEIASLQDVSEGLENVIKKAANSCNNLEELIAMIKSKRYTESRIKRILLYSLLNITKKDIQNSYKINPYIRVLGVSPHGKILLSQMNSKNFKTPVITSVKKFIDDNKNRVLQDMIEKDINASNIYTLGYEYDSKANLDFTQKIITLN